MESMLGKEEKNIYGVIITGLTMKMKKYGFCLVDWISYFVLIKEKL